MSVPTKKKVTVTNRDVARPAGFSSIDSPEATEALNGAGIPVAETWDWPENRTDVLADFSHRDAGFAMTECKRQR